MRQKAHFWRTLIGIAALCSNAASLAQERPVSAVIENFSDKSSVSWVDSDGNIGVIKLAATGMGSGEFGVGSDSPLVAKNGRFIAFVRNRDLWVRDVSTGKDTQVTNVGAPYTDEYASVEIRITEWAPESDRILYAVISGYTQNPDSDSEDDWEKKKRSVDFGFHVYDVLNKKKGARIEFPMRMLAWLEKNKFLLIDNEYQPRSARLYLWEPGQSAPKQVPAKMGDYLQVDVSPDRASIAAIFSMEINKMQVVKLDLRTGAMSAVTPIGQWAQYHNPKYSPDGTRIAYVHGEKSAIRGRQLTHIMVSDGKSIGPFIGYLHYIWVTNDTLAINELCGLNVVRISTGKVLGYDQHLSPESASLGVDCSKNTNTRVLP